MIFIFHGNIQEIILYQLPTIYFYILKYLQGVLKVFSNLESELKINKHWFPNKSNNLIWYLLIYLSIYIYLFSVDHLIRQKKKEATIDILQ